MSHLPDKLRACRLELKLTQEEAALQSGFIQRDISRFEKGRAKTIPNGYMQWLHKNGVDLNKLFDESVSASPIASLFASPNQKDKINPEKKEMHEPGTPQLKVTRGGKELYPSNQPPLVVVVDRDGHERISLVSSQAAAGYPQLYLEPEYIRDLPTFNIPTPEFNSGTFRGFEIRGDSMATTIKPGEWVISRYVDNWPSNIKNGYIYVVITNEAILLKRVTNRILERRTLVLQSDNEDYETMEVDAADVLELWDVKASLRFRFPASTRFNTLRKVRELEADFNHLRKEVETLKKGQKKGH